MRSGGYRKINTVEQIQAQMEREKVLSRLVHEAGGMTKYARKVGLTKSAVEKALHGSCSISDKMLGLSKRA
jgi:DNA-binding phage protein